MFPCQTALLRARTSVGRAGREDWWGRSREESSLRHNAVLRSETCDHHNTQIGPTRVGVIFISSDSICDMITKLTDLIIIR